MPDPVINPLASNMGMQGEAFAAASEITLTQTDRKMIEEMGGILEPRKPFIDVFKDKPLLPTVENQETTIKLPQQNAMAIASQFEQHRKMLKHSATPGHREHVTISSKAPDKLGEKKEEIPPAPLLEEKSGPPKEETAKPVDPEQHAVASEIARELNLNPAELFDKFNLEQKELFSLVSRLRELHFKRLLCGTLQEFESLSKEILASSMRSAKPGEQAWLEKQLNRLALEAANYKLGIFNSLQNMEYNENRKKDIQWLETEVKKLSKA